MSYILDALKKADAARERGSVPGLHARPVMTPAAPRAPTANKGLWLALVVGLTLAGGAALVWDTKAPVKAIPAAQQPASAAVALAPTVVATPQPLAKPEPRTPPKPPTAAASILKRASSPPTDTTKPTAVAVAPLLGELPTDIRSQIPALSISGSVYSDNPLQRVLLVNGQVLTQGSQVAPDTILVEIQRSSSEFNFRGTRFRLAH